MITKRGQLTVFVILALAIVVGIVLFFVFRSSVEVEGLSQDLRPAYDYYLSCIEDQTRLAIDVAGTQGGRIYTGNYIPGSDFAPFSNHLNFLGNSVPYWYYVSGNGFVRENVPSKADIEEDIEQFVGENLVNCDFDRFVAQGYDVSFENPDVDVNIEESRVTVTVNSDFDVSRGEDAASLQSHSVEVDSKLGKFYSMAREIYAKELESAFLENYGVDVLRLYAPVDGVEIQCSPKIWKTREIVSDVKDALEANIGSLKVGGDYYSLRDERGEYFVVDGLSSDESVQFLYSDAWPTKVEVTGEGVDEDLTVAEPVGTQSGMGIMGFCYVPYHFVYDLSYPVMVQVYNNEEVFQFPVVAVVDNNIARNSQAASYLIEEESFDLCEFKDQDVVVNVYDSNLNPVDANISFECFTQRCSLGETENGVLTGKSPACLNGYLRVRSDGYAEKKQLFSSNEQITADVILEKEYDADVEVRMDGEVLDDRVIVSFTKDGGDSASAVLPEVKEVKLTEGQYEIRVYVYSDSNLTIPSSSRTECREVSRGGVLGFFGSTKEECFDITIPETRIESALAGGGVSDVYILGDQLEGGKVIINVGSLPEPETVEQLQYNFEAFEHNFVEVNFE